MKTLIIPDIHNKIHVVDKILASEGNYDRAIFLGDYFDDFSDTEYQAIATANWLKRVLADPRHICLIGNHDLSYIYPTSRAAYCPGWSPLKSSAVNCVLNSNDWSKLQFFTEAEGIVFSHAGVSAKFYSVEPDDYSTLRDTLNADLEYACRQLTHSTSSKILGAGYDRGGRQEVGGILWCDHSSHIPLQKIPQIYGHSPLRTPDYRIRNVKLENTFFCSPFDGRGILEDYHIDKPWSLGLDTHLKHYGVIESKTLSIVDVATLTPIHFRKLK